MTLGEFWWNFLKINFSQGNEWWGVGSFRKIVQISAQDYKFLCPVYDFISAILVNTLTHTEVLPVTCD